MRRLRERLLAWAEKYPVRAGCAALFLPSIVLLSSVNNILANNDDELVYQPLKFAWIYGAFAVIALAIYLCLLRAPNSAVGRAASRIALALGVLALLFNITQGLLQHSPFVVGLIADLATLTLVAALTVAIPFRHLVSIFAVIGILFFVTGVTSHARAASKFLRRQASIAHLLHPKPADNITVSAGNVYHIVLDSFQSDAFDLLRAESAEPVLSEFVYFKEFRANYGRTHLSMASIRLSEFYDGTENLYSWAGRKPRDHGLLPLLHDAKVTLHQYPYYLSYCTEFTNFCYSQTLDTLRKQSFFVVVDLAFQSLLPETAKRLLTGDLEPKVVARLGEQRSLGISLSSYLWPSAAEIRRRFVPLNIHPYFSVTAFDRLLEGLGDLPPQGQYVFFHAILPHGPNVYDRACTFTYNAEAGRAGDEPERVVPAYLEQSRCAVALVRRLTERLKALGRFEASLIVVHSDHGHHLVRLPDGTLSPESDAMAAGKVRQFHWNRDPPEDWPQEVLEGTSRALLLVKFPGDTDGRISTAPAQGLDIAPTVLFHFGIATDGLRGTPLQRLDEASEREVIFFANNRDYPDYFAKYRLERGVWSYQEKLDAKNER